MKLTIASLREKLQRREISAVETTQEFLARIKKTDPDIHAFLSAQAEAAITEAEAVDKSIARDEPLPPLAGVPLAVKDAILIKDRPATAASKILENYIASYDATVIRKLRAAGAVFLGKTNMDEFAMGASNENSAFGPVKNPRDLTRVPGGSSGGSAAAVAAEMALAALGSDTGGSVRQPASFCGVVGLKPTYGAISRSGLIAMASSLDQIGPLTRTVQDAALMFDAMRGPDPLDATSANNVVYDASLTAPDFAEIKNLTIGLPEEYFIDGLDPRVAGAMDDVIKTLTQYGLRFKKISLPHTKYALACYYIIMPAEVSANLARFDGIRYARLAAVDTAATLGEIYLKQRGLGLGAEAKRRIILGTFVLSSGYYDAYYAKAQAVRTLITRDFADAFRQVDVILTPVAPTPAFKLGEKMSDPLSMYLSDIFTISLNLAGLPGLSVPAQSSHAKPLPIGFQLIGRPFHEADILGLGQWYEKVTGAGNNDLRCR